MRYHVQAEIHIHGDDDLLRAVSGLKAATIIANSGDPAKVVAVSSGGRRGALMLAPYAPVMPGTDAPIDEGESITGQAPQYAKGCRLMATLDCGDVPDAVSAVVRVDVIVHEMESWYAGPTGKSDIRVELASYQAYAGPVDMFERLPEVMKMAGKLMRRGYDRGDGDDWKPEEGDDDKDPT